MEKDNIVKSDVVVKREYKYIECECDSSDHTIRLIKDTDYIPASDEIETSIYLEVQLCRTKNVFQRIWAAIKYVCGYECKYGHWDCTLLSPSSRNQIISFLEDVKND